MVTSLNYNNDQQCMVSMQVTGRCRSTKDLSGWGRAVKAAHQAGPSLRTTKQRPYQSRCMPRAGNAAVKDCLEESREEEGFSPECKQELETMMERRAKDVRLDIALMAVSQRMHERVTLPLRAGARSELAAEPRKGHADQHRLSK